METLPSWEGRSVVFPFLRRDLIPATALQAGLQPLKLYIGMCVRDVACWILPTICPSYGLPSERADERGGEVLPQVITELRGKK